MKHYYEKVDEDMRRVYAPTNDANGEITGHHVIGLQAWFDENPEERKRLGYVKHIYYEPDELKELFPFHPGTQVRLRHTVEVDQWTVKDDYTVYDKTEELLLLEEELRMLGDDFDYGGPMNIIL